MNPWDFVRPEWVRNFVATEADIAREYASVENFKYFLTEKYSDHIRFMGETMLATMKGIPPTIMILSKRHKVEQLDITHLQISPFYQSDATKDQIPGFLRYTIVKEFSGRPQEKIFGVLFYSEAWVTELKTPAAVKEITVEKLPSEDPARIEIAVMFADFICGGAMMAFEIARPHGRPAHLKERPGYAGKLEFQLGPDGKEENRGRMYGLLRKACGLYKPQHGIKFNMPKK